MRFSGFDDEWIEEKLGNLVQIKSGECTKNLITGIDNSIPYFKVEQLNNSLKYQIKTPYFINDKSKIVNKGSIIFPKRGAAILLNKIRILNQDSFMDTNLMTLTPNNKLYNEFLYYFIYKENLSKIADTTSIPQLNNKHIKPYPIKLPSFEEQLKISKFISSVDKKVSLLSQNLEIFNDFKKGLLQQIFTQKLRFVDFNNSSWKDYKFKDLGTVKSGVGFSNKYQGHLDLDYNFYKVSDMNLKGNEKVMTRSNNTIDDNLLKDIGVKLIENPSIIFAKVGEAIFLNRKRIAKQPFLIDNNMMAFSPNENVDLEFMYYLATSINFGKYAQTGALPSYNASDIYSIKCKIPPIEEQKRIGKLLSLADNKIDFCSNQLNKTQEFKKGLLQQMFVVRINWRCNFKLAKSPSFNKHLLILKNKIIFIIIE